MHSKEYQTFSYCHRFSQINNYTVKYNRSGRSCYGNIESFFTIDGITCCIIKKFSIEREAVYSGLTDNHLIIKHCNTFFLFVQITNEYELILCEQIKCKCILVDVINELKETKTFISPCVGFEHD